MDVDGSWISTTSDALHGNLERTSRNPLVDDHVYTKVKRTKNFEARPAVIHFPGLEVGRFYEKSVRIVNVSRFTQRLHILPPQTHFFSFQYDKKGKISPGMSEKIFIQFSPNELRYYHDAIRIHCDGENLLVPLHAYPTISPSVPAPSVTLPPSSGKNELVFFPKQIDFGMCLLAQEHQRLLPVRSHVPLEFDFSIRIMSAHPDMQVEPQQGRVPPLGQVEVVLTYTPSRMVTAEMILEIQIEQFNFHPHRLSVIGSARPNARRQAALEDLTASLRGEGDFVELQELEQVDKPMRVGEGRVDVVRLHDETRSSEEMQRRGEKERTGGATQTSRKSPAEAEGNIEMKGVMIPADLRTRKATQYVLNQVTGKRSWKELKRQMEESGERIGGEEQLDPKSKALESIRWYETVRMQPGGFLDVEEEYGDSSQQIKEFKFTFELRMREGYDKAKDVKWFPAIGDEPTSQEEKEEVEARRTCREQRRAEEMARKREALRRMAATEAREQVRVAHATEVVSCCAPTFDPYLNDAWTVRKEVTRNLLTQIHKVIIRNRVERRIAAINNKLDVMEGASGRLVDSILTAESLPPTSQGKRESGVGGGMTTEKFLVSLFPSYRPANFRDREPVPVRAAEVAEEWNFLLLKVPSTYKLMGYREEQREAISVYMPAEEEREPRTGAGAEEGIRGPRGSMAPSEEQPLLEMPGCCVEEPGGQKVCACRFFEPSNAPAIGRQKCFVYEAVEDHEETAIDFELRAFPRVVCDEDLKCHSSIPEKNRGKPLEAVLMGPVIEGAIVPEPEPPSMNTVRSYRGNFAPVLSSRWLAKNELPSFLTSPTPTFMYGPDAADQQSDHEEEEEEGGEEEGDSKPPPVTISPPTERSIRETFKLPANLRKDNETEGGEGEREGGGEEAEGEGNEGKEEAPEHKEGVQPVKIPLNARTMHEMEMEAEIRQARKECLALLPAELHKINQLIADPKKKIPVEPSIYQPSPLHWLNLPPREAVNSK
ncbi:hypothetical protein GUITHDRAFT_164378 [Guillardia theta CCMP2712]|uniref:Abnormal spindle-like microcephaly-associated protein ASH domain-containing protein n=1 Tax=Guillardia theta (strain CCMP2712) TaxID=905079 RepID=L1J0A1_GUITC|nr:hypothetical protein GUITHDRAFT_164378 [Guillardia theta CCMP2712]EKX41515.1 hypothetical protein GUITHDRAFT_164378 [Guillardia theta CCMP2712]|eukprot:XP_005828495.1 hypothetical protein GUITHDRAFT_164378 [Guillardia theta CCMP2712]